MPTTQPNRETRRKLDKTKKKIDAEAAKVRRDRQTERIARHGVTDAAAWRRGRAPVLVELPSGNICRAVNKGLDAMLKRGKVPNSLMPLINSALAEGENRPGKKDIAKDVLESPEQLEAAIDFANAVVCDCVVEPKILPVPLEDDGNGVMVEIPLGDDRDEWAEDHGIDPEEALWVDETDLNDRLFLMTWVLGGTQDVEQFRQEQADDVDDLLAGEGTQSEA